MSRESQEMIKILPNMCKRLGLDKGVVCERTKALLKSKRDMDWFMEAFQEDGNDDIYYYCESELKAAVKWLQGYYKALSNDGFDDYVPVLWESRLMDKLFDEVMKKLAQFKKYGDLYVQLIRLRYLSDETPVETEITEKLGICRSSYYSRLNEACIAFGILLQTFLGLSPDKVPISVPMTAERISL